MQEIRMLPARRELTAFVEMRAQQVARETGFGWHADAHAPDTYFDLGVMWSRSIVTGMPLPVYDGHCDKTLYLRPKANLAARFLHDATHMEARLTFSPEDERMVASLQLEDASHHKLGSDASLLLFLDTAAQIEYLEAFGQFPDDQATFVIDCFERGITAVLRELKLAREMAA